MISVVYFQLLTRSLGNSRASSEEIASDPSCGGSGCADGSVVVVPEDDSEESKGEEEASKRGALFDLLALAFVFGGEGGGVEPRRHAKPRNAVAPTQNNAV